MRLLPSLLSALLLVSLAVPLASAAGSSCGDPAEVGLAPWAVCQVYEGGDAVDAALCLGWALVWGPNDPCPFPIPL